MTKPATLAAAGSSANRTGKDLDPTIPPPPVTTGLPRCGLCDSAAAAWRAYWTDDAIRQRTLDELEVASLIARWQIRMAGLDIREAIDDWPRVQDVVDARRRGYEPLDRTPNPWPPESLDRDTWRETDEPSPHVPPEKRFRRHDAYFQQKQARREVAA
jgi:hypothetical protein